MSLHHHPCRFCKKAYPEYEGLKSHVISQHKADYQRVKTWIEETTAPNERFHDMPRMQTGDGFIGGDPQIRRYDPDALL